MKLHSVLLAGVVVASPIGGTAMAACATDEEVAAYVTDYLASTPTRALVPDGTMEDALCTQAKLSEALTEHMGPVVGYKTGLTSKPAQERFGVNEPVRGVLYEKMLLPDGAAVPADWGARTVFEADLILVVGSEAINDAESSAEAMQHIAAIRPFLELPDLMLAEGEPVNAVTLTAIGVASRLGVLGPAIDVSDPGAMHDALAGMTVRLLAADGKVLSEAPGTAVLGHPVNSALWLVSKGVRLKEGDLVSVGSFGPLMPPGKGNGGARVVYEGLPGNPSASVTFE